MARWIEEGCASSAGISRSSAASTAARSSSKNAGRFIGWKVAPGARQRCGRLGIFLGFGIEGFRRHLAAGFLEQNFHFALGLFQIFLAITRELHAFLEQLHGFVERKIRAFE